jgi:anaerobic selenocysteine-containing dehydrogenase
LPANLNAEEIEVLFINEANPYYVFSDRHALKEIFEDIPYIVSFSSYMDETSARADIILPVPTPFERWDDQIGVRGLPFAVYNMNRPIIPPVHQTRNAADSLIAISHAMGGTIAESFPWNNVAEVLRFRARGLCESGRGSIRGLATGALQDETETSDSAERSELNFFTSFWGRLVEEGCWYDPTQGYGDPERFLKTPDKKFEFYSRQLRNTFGFSEDVRCMPHYGEAPPRPKDFDLLIMPKNMITMADNGTGTPPMLIKQLSDTTLKGNDLFVQINPITAMYHNLNNGDLVILETSMGRVKVRIHQFAGVREGVVWIPMGFGHSAFDRFLQGKGINARLLFDVKKDTISGLPIFWGTPARIIKA